MIEKLLQFLDIDDSTQRLGRDLWEVLAPSVEPVLDTFYQKVDRAGIEPQLSDATVARLKAEQKAHWEALFRSQFDEDYMMRVRRIGIRHRDIGLNVGSYLAGYITLKIEFGNVIIQSELPVLTKGLLIKTLDKYVAFDMALALSTHDAAILD